MILSRLANEDIQQQIIPYWGSSHRLSALFRLRLIRSHKDQYDWLDREFDNIHASFSWLATQSGQEEAQSLTEYIRLLAPYLQQRGLQAELLQWCDAGIQHAKALQQITGWLFLLRGQTQYALGQWTEARMSFQIAIQESEKEDQQTYAHVTLALGRLEFNQGNYHIAFQTMNAANDIFMKEADQEQVLVILSETAAYHLNKREFDKALALYHRVDRLHKEHGTNESSDHTLLMLGVVYRRKKNYDQAKAYLQQLIDRAGAQQNRSAIATGAHHLAWTFLSQRDTFKARQLCGRSIVLYEEIGDERGLATAYEQLGCIALADGQGKEAIQYFQRALARKRQVHNQQGEASVLRHLAIAYLTMGQLPQAFKSLWKSLVLYQQLGVLTRQRIVSIFRECLSWAVGWRIWEK